MGKPMFTPGPWSLVENKFMEFVVVQTETDRNVILLDDGETDVEIEFAEVRANAHLIAAAPALYEALCSMIGRYAKFGPFDEILGSSEQTIETNEALAALKAARGDSLTPEEGLK